MDAEITTTCDQLPIRSTRQGRRWSFRPAAASCPPRTMAPAMGNVFHLGRGRAAGAQNGEHAARGDDWEAGRGTSGLVLPRAAAFAGGAGHHVTLNLFVDVGDSSLGDLIVEVGVHRVSLCRS